MVVTKTDPSNQKHISVYFSDKCSNIHNIYFALRVAVSRCCCCCFCYCRERSVNQISLIYCVACRHLPPWYFFPLFTHPNIACMMAWWCKLCAKNKKNETKKNRFRCCTCDVFSDHIHSHCFSRVTIFHSCVSVLYRTVMRSRTRKQRTLQQYAIDKDRKFVKKNNNEESHDYWFRRIELTHFKAIAFYILLLLFYALGLIVDYLLISKLRSWVLTFFHRLGSCLAFTHFSHYLCMVSIFYLRKISSVCTFFCWFFSLQFFRKIK